MKNVKNFKAFEALKPNSTVKEIEWFDEVYEINSADDFNGLFYGKKGGLWYSLRHEASGVVQVIDVASDLSKLLVNDSVFIKAI